jgi:hypothetical protein
MQRIFLFGLGILLVTVSAIAQIDTTKKRTVNITSTFKPVLREAAKINFNASPPLSDTTRPRLQYTLPNQNLLFAYQPGTLKPLALQVDSGGRWDNDSYIKVGFGSLRTPFLQTGISFGDGKTAGINIYAKHVSSQGKREFQDFSNTNVALNGFFLTSKNLEWNARLGMINEIYYKYGFLPETLTYPKDSLKQKYQAWSGRVSFHNINLTEFSLSYAPEIKIDVFGDQLKTNESNTYLNLPLEKKIGKTLTAHLGITFDATRLKPLGKTAVNNTMYYISPSVVFNNPMLKINAGIRPSWDNQVFKLFPNVMAEISTPDNRFTIIAGWIGIIRQTSYQYLASLNPWIWTPTSLKNTWIEERYAGFRGSLGDHFNYSTKLGFNKLTNQPLFVNDSADGKSFHVVNESQMKVFHFGGEIGYTLQERLSLLAGINVNQYTGLKDNAKAWGMLPLELKGAMRLQILKDLTVTSDLFAWMGPKYLKSDQSIGELKGAFDLNAGLEFRVTKNLNLWAQFNNLLNKSYQRWNQYPVYGFSFVGGVVYSFAQNNVKQLVGNSQ